MMRRVPPYIDSFELNRLRISRVPRLSAFFRFKSGTSSRRWIDRQASDFYTKQSLAEGYRSRAAYKLLEINKRFNVLKKSSKNIVDLGFAPGAWTQVVAARSAQLGITSKILGVDLQDCAPPPGCTFIRGDIFSRATHKNIDDFFTGEGVHVVLSDMMSNTTGHGELDHLASMELCEGVLMLSERLLRKKGSLVMKFFTGSHDCDLREKLDLHFEKVYTMKPKACRSSSREMYFIALGKKYERLS